MRSQTSRNLTFNVTEHVIPCQHIRGYSHSVKEPLVALKLVVAEYVPKRAISSYESSVTIIAAHANGIVKETYEPLWEELDAKLDGRIRSIWIADCSHQGASGVLNEGVQGDDPNWFDHSRDLLSMVNHFRESMRPPIIGVAHSMGCAQLVKLATMHPRLFQSLILIEPVIQDAIPKGPNAAMMTSLRPDRWESFDSAKSCFENNKFYKSWDRRALDKYLEYGLRPLPTALYPKYNHGAAVTLTTTKAQEAWSYVRSTFASRASAEFLDDQERRITADYTSDQAQYVFHRAEAGEALQLLPTLQPSVKWIFGKCSYINRAADCDSKIACTGKTARGSGGVTAEFLDRGGHLVPLEMVSQTADAIVPYLRLQLDAYDEQRVFWENYKSEKSDVTDGLDLSKRWMEEVRQKSDRLRPIKVPGKL